MKRLLAKALEQVATETVEIAQGGPDLRREIRFIQISMELQERKLDEIQQIMKGEQQGADKEENQQHATEEN